MPQGRHVETNGYIRIKCRYHPLAETRAQLDECGMHYLDYDEDEHDSDCGVLHPVPASSRADGHTGQRMNQTLKNA